jgi:DNA-binding MarR family transcriptional regulator
MKLEIVEKLYSVANFLNAEEKQSRNYGTEHSMFHSEVHLIVAMFNHKNANVSELAEALKITTGAVSQVANKLVKKGLIEKHKGKESLKDTFYKLTEEGEKVYYGHENHHKMLNAGVLEYMDSLTSDQVVTIVTFLDKVTEIMPLALGL